VLQRFAEKRICHTKKNVGQGVCIARCNVFEIRIVDGVKWTIVGAVGQGVDDGGEVLHCGGAEGWRGRHYYQGFSGEHKLPQRVDMLHDG